MAYRDRQGTEISAERWADLWEEIEYRVVHDSRVGKAVVRTVWEGVDDVGGSMFATGVSFNGGQSWQNVMERARTEAEALELHAAVEKQLSAK
ncbi:hypothetical protein AB0B15_03120 [Streptomyces sp. NPDC045456]|uniref:hypothetical protein n=1 Tax=Streptomyces sp. NPDC045456 TaxID=3155254 RepID=UPI003409678F